MRRSSSMAGELAVSASVRQPRTRPVSHRCPIAGSSGSEPSSGMFSAAASAPTPPALGGKMTEVVPHLRQTNPAMFSTRPITGTFTLRQNASCFRTSASATSCGVDTKMAPRNFPLSLRYWTIDRCSSDVPGGVSTSSASTAPHSTSRKNCRIRPSFLPPRQTTAWSSRSSRNAMLIRPMDSVIHCGSHPLALVRTDPDTLPSRRGREGPQMSMSSRPTDTGSSSSSSSSSTSWWLSLFLLAFLVDGESVLASARRRRRTIVEIASARCTVNVDLPTPPLPDMIKKNSSHLVQPLFNKSPLFYHLFFLIFTSST
mmetsp:Transcript_16729/g.52286  ORF Transcript_16729/g.52286 Transcript_16729/m.52286 type:complete len:314 (-) Transcript_16729:258-1199(-)